MTLQPKSINRFPLRDDNHFSLLVDGDKFFASIYDDIHKAKHSVCIEMYLMASGETSKQLIDALVNASKRQVRVYVLLDAYGSSKLSMRERDRMIDTGINLALYNPFSFRHIKRSLHRTHRKIILIDSQIAYTGGAGFTDEFAPAKIPEDYWHDVMVRITGSCVFDWLALFSENWSRWSKIELTSVDTESTLKTTKPGICKGRVVANRSLSHSEIRRSLIRHIRSAKKHIWIATPYFVPSRKVRRLLIKSVKKNIDTRLLLPGPITDHAGSRHMARRYYHKLLKAGVGIYEYQHRFMHAKVFFVDDWVSVGSSNMDRWGLIWNLDANQEVLDTKFNIEVKAFFTKDFQQSSKFDYQSWRNRPWKERLLEQLWGRVVSLLAWFSDNVKELDRR